MLVNVHCGRATARLINVASTQHVAVGRLDWRHVVVDRVATETLIAVLDAGQREPLVKTGAGTVFNRELIHGGPVAAQGPREGVVGETPQGGPAIDLWWSSASGKEAEADLAAADLTGVTNTRLVAVGRVCNRVGREPVAAVALPAPLDPGVIVAELGTVVYTAGLR